MVTFGFSVRAWTRTVRGPLVATRRSAISRRSRAARTCRPVCDASVWMPPAERSTSASTAGRSRSFSMRPASRLTAPRSKETSTGTDASTRPPESPRTVRLMMPPERERSTAWPTERSMLTPTRACSAVSLKVLPL